MITNGLIGFAGFLLGVFVCGIILISFSIIELAPWSVEKYDGLLAAFLALVGAIFTVLMISNQISQSERHFRHMRNRRLLAARAVLPHTLTMLNDYAEGAVKYSIDLYRHHFSIEELTKGEAFKGMVPAIPTGSIEALKDCIEYADEKTAENLSLLLSWLQIQNSRLIDAPLDSGLEGNHIRVVSEYGLSMYIHDALKLQLMLSPFYEYARKEITEVRTIPLKRNSFIMSLMATYFVEKQDMPELFNRLDHYYPDNELSTKCT